MKTFVNVTPKSFWDYKDHDLLKKIVKIYKIVLLKPFVSDHAESAGVHVEKNLKHHIFPGLSSKPEGEVCGIFFVTIFLIWNL